jgi:hypothetical protein
MAETTTITPPAGFTLDPTPAAQATPPITPPAGFTLDAPASGADIPAPAPGLMGKIVGGMIKETGDVLSGVGGGVFETAEGAKNLANKVLPASAQIPDIPKEYREERNAGEKVGGVVENIGEFAAGDEALKGLAKASKMVELADKYPIVAKTLEMAKTHPALTKIIASTTKAGLVGGGQGAVKGAAEGDAGREALAGGAGGALTAGTVEGVAQGLRPFARILGIGGLTANEALTKAGRPYVGETNWNENLDKALPRLVEANKTTPVKTVGDFEDLAHNAADNLWKKEIAPQIERHADEALDTTPVRDKVQAAATRSMKKYFPEEAAEIESFASNFGAPTTVAEANEDIQAFNAKLKSYYKASPSERAAVLKTEGSASAIEAAADGLRDQLYGHLEAQGENVPGDLRKQYGALKQIERVFGKRATVADRQAPLDFKQTLGAMEAVGAVAAGHPAVAAAGAIPWLTKFRNSPESLVKQGLSAAEREAATPSAFKEGVKAGGKTATSAAGSLAGRYLFKNSDGGVHSVPDTPDNRKAVSDTDPYRTPLTTPQQ